MRVPVPAGLLLLNTAYALVYIAALSRRRDVHLHAAGLQMSVRQQRVTFVCALAAMLALVVLVQVVRDRDVSPYDAVEDRMSSTSRSGEVMKKAALSYDARARRRVLDPRAAALRRRAAEGGRRRGVTTCCIRCSI